MKLSDAKFIGRSIERAQPRRPEAPDPADLSVLRGVAEKHRREAGELLPELDDSYEPVSFIHPTHNRRVYGWLVAVDDDGNGCVEIGDGEYAVVPPTDLRRLGTRNDRTEVQESLRRVMGTVSTDGAGVRTDFHETSNLVPLGVSGSDSGNGDLRLMSLGYASTVGLPTDGEIVEYVRRSHPTASIVEADASMPGRVGVVLHFAEDKDAEMGAAVGGEVLEILDPDEDVVSGKDADIEKTAQTAPVNLPSFPFDPKGRRVPRHPQTRPIQQPVSPAGPGRRPTSTPAVLPVTESVTPTVGGVEAPTGGAGPTTPTTPTTVGGPAKAETGPVAGEAAAKASAPQYKPGTSFRPDYRALGTGLAQSKETGLIGDVLDQYFKQGGGRALARANVDSFTLEGLLQAAMPVVHRSSYSLWSKVKAVAPGGAGKYPEAEKAAQGSPAQEALAQNTPAQGTPAIPSMPATPTTPDSTMTPPVSTTGPDASGFMPVTQEMAPPGSMSLMGHKAKRAALFNNPSAKTAGYDHLTRAGLPPALKDIFLTMKMYRMARRGDYIIAKVEWDPKCLEGRSVHAVKQAVESFVKAQAGASRQGANFGIIGRVYVLALNAKTGVAQVQFSSEFAGPVPTAVDVE